jgi:hypothetical protein
MRINALIAVIAASLVTAGAAQAAAPTATTRGASAITDAGAKLSGSVKPNNQPTTWHFEFGTTTAYGSATAEQGPIPPGSGTQTVTADIGGLVAGTTYHYRLVATNPAGGTAGKDRTFTTRPAISINTSLPVVPFGGSQTLTGQVYGTAVSGITVTLQENPYPFAGFGDIATTTTDAGGRYQFIRPVTMNTAYRVIAQTKPPGTSATAFSYEQDAVSLRANRSRVRRGQTVLFTGTSAPARVGTPVWVQRLGRNGWGTVLRTTLAPTTQPTIASFAVRLRRVVPGLYRAFVPGGYDHLAGTSAAARIRLR